METADNQNENEIKRKTGIKLLMTLKNAKDIYDKYTGTSIDEYYDFLEKKDEFLREIQDDIDKEELEMISNDNNKAEILEEKSEEMLKDVDSMINDIRDLRAKINDFKLANKIKSKIEYLKYMNSLNESQENEEKKLARSQELFYSKLKKEFVNKNNELKKLLQYKKYLIPKHNEQEKVFSDIKEKLKKQKEEMEKNEILNENKLEDSGNEINEGKDLQELTGDEEVDRLFAQIKLANLQMDDYLKDIDDCLEMNETIKKNLEKEELNQNENNREEKEKKANITENV